MKIFKWFSKMTLQGKIKKRLGKISAAEGKGKLEIQLMEKLLNSGRVYRFNIIWTSLISYQSLPITLKEEDIKQLIGILSESVDN